MELRSISPRISRNSVTRSIRQRHRERSTRPAGIGPDARVGLSTRYLHRDPAHATGAATVKINAAGQPQFTIHRPSAYDFPQLSEADSTHLFAEAVDWIYFGTLHQMSPAAKNLTSRLLDSSGAAHKFYDLNLRQNSYDAGLIRELMARASIMKMNDEEVVTIAKLFGYAYESLEKFCRDYAQKFGWEAVCVTRGSKGCSLLIGGQFVEMPGYAIQVADAVGAGDAFAAGFVHGFSNDWPRPRSPILPIGLVH